MKEYLRPVLEATMRKNDDPNTKKVLISELWFETDGYGAAVAGILKSIQLGLASPSIGIGGEDHILRAVLSELLKLDPDIRVEEWMR